MRPTDADVEALAKRLHKLAMKYNADHGGRASISYKRTTEFFRARLRFVAADLLSNPPAPLAAPAQHRKPR